MGGAGLSPSPATALQANSSGYVDYVDAFGNTVGSGGSNAPSGAVYTRRWSVDPLPTDPNNTVVLQVLVFRTKDRGAADRSNVSRMPGEARLISVKRRKVS